MSSDQRRWVDPKTLRKGPIRHESLSEDFLARVRKFHSMLAEVDGMTIEERVDCFRRDLHPENEIVVWEAIARAFERFCRARDLSADAKRDVYSLLLMRSMTTEAETLKRVDFKALSLDDADKLLRGLP